MRNYSLPLSASSCPQEAEEIHQIVQPNIPKSRDRNSDVACNFPLMGKFSLKLSPCRAQLDDPSVKDRQKGLLL